MNKPWLHLGVEAVKAIHAQVLAAHGGADGLRDPGMLESAVAVPQATWAGDPLISDPHEIAAAYLFYLSRNHPFVDGNKRVALATCLAFLSLNELWDISELPADDWEALVLDVAGSRLDRDQTTARLKKLLKPRRKPARKPRR